MSLSLGPFITCFLGIAFLTGYLYIILYRSKNFFAYNTKIIFVGITIIFLRLCIPLNFPFTYTIYSAKILLPISKILYADSGILDYDIFDLFIIIWIIGAITKIVVLCHQKIQLHNYLKEFVIDEHSQYTEILELVQKYYSKDLKIAIIPATVSPAVSGILHPTLILPDNCDLSNEEMKYICLHEIEHCQNHDLWMKMFIEIIACIHWWNPLVYLVKKEYFLTLEVANDCFLMKTQPNVNNIKYADLILKVAKMSMFSSLPKSADTVHFVGKNSSNLKTRISFVLNQPEKKIKERPMMITNLLTLCIAVVFTLLFVIDPTAPISDEKKGDSFALDSSNAYLLKVSEGYEIYIDDEYTGTIKEIPEDFKNLKIYTNTEDFPNEDKQN
ncbi:M56 family metallopeptidase [Bariatricus sp. SGI.154]|uniref:M56 family metallopeptidase n=1 Tax=Bariatricus sp. SGI.154 TaxID=3420549 RepID=UPI003D035C84